MARVEPAGRAADAPALDLRIPPAIAQQLVEAARRLGARGWLDATGGNLSAVVCEDPLLLAITRSGAHKRDLQPADLLLVDNHGVVLAGDGRPSAELALHLLLARRGARAVVHTHSAHATAISLTHAGDELELGGFEMTKALAGITTHEHSERLPLVDNDQDMARMSDRLARRFPTAPAVHGFLVRGHGLYAWGRDIPSAERHVEALEFLLKTKLMVGLAHRGGA